MLHPRLGPVLWTSVFSIVSLLLPSCETPDTPVSKAPESQETPLKEGQKVQQPASPPTEQGPNTAQEQQKQPMQTHQAAGSALAEQGDPNCVALPPNRIAPFYLNDKNLFVTRIRPECKTAALETGFKPEAKWVAMGIPCTGGGGQLDWRGKYGAPKMVSFLFTNDCPTLPKTSAEVSQSATGVFPLPIQLAAYIPMAVQYWEIPEANDADIGFRVSLRTNLGVRRIWPRLLRQKEGMQLYLYGRENSWLGNKQLYEVRGTVEVTQGRRMFGFKVDRVRILNPQETQEVKQRCELLRPKRRCSRVFR